METSVILAGVLFTTISLPSSQRIPKFPYPRGIQRTYMSLNHWRRFVWNLKNHPTDHPTIETHCTETTAGRRSRECKRLLSKVIGGWTCTYPMKWNGSHNNITTFQLWFWLWLQRNGRNLLKFILWTIVLRYRTRSVIDQPKLVGPKLKKNLDHYCSATMHQAIHHWTRLPALDLSIFPTLNVTDSIVLVGNQLYSKFYQSLVQYQFLVFACVTLNGTNPNSYSTW